MYIYIYILYNKYTWRERERGRIASLCIYICTHCTYASTIATTNRRGLPGLKHRGISTSSMGSSTWSPELLVTRLVAHHSLAEISWPWLWLRHCERKTAAKSNITNITTELLRTARISIFLPSDNRRAQLLIKVTPQSPGQQVCAKRTNELEALYIQYTYIYIL